MQLVSSGLIVSLLLVLKFLRLLETLATDLMSTTTLFKTPIRDLFLCWMATTEYRGFTLSTIRCSI